MAEYEAARQRWKEAADKGRTRDALFTTLSMKDIPLLGHPAPDSLTEEQGAAYLTELGFPGQFPYTRGLHPNLYRGRLWTQRQFAGFGNARDTNKRYHFLLERGQTGLSVAFDMPTLMGYDADHGLSEGEVGRCGVSISSLADMEVLFDGIPLGDVSTSMTINGPAAVIWAMYIVAAEKQGVAQEKLRGTLQNDILKEYIAQKEYLFPPAPSMRLLVDTIEYGTHHMPRWNTVSVSGYHIREAGSTAAQELAFTLADGFAYVEASIERGLDVDAFAPRLSFFFNSHSDFFEEIAKFRAARRIWAKRMKNKYGAKNPKSWMLRFHTQTAGCSLTAQQPENNIVRTALQALAAVLGGTQSLHTNSMDETLALPTEKAVEIALRTQQIIAEESAVPHTVDPLGGSWFVEQMTDSMEAQAEEYFARIDAHGGVVPAIEAGFFQAEIGEASYALQKEYESGRRVIVGVNKYRHEETAPSHLETLKITQETENQAIKDHRAVLARRNAEAVRKRLENVRQVALDGTNLMPAIIDAVREYATLGEICQTLKEVFGTYSEPAGF